MSNEQSTKNAPSQVTKKGLFLTTSTRYLCKAEDENDDDDDQSDDDWSVIITLSTLSLTNYRIPGQEKKTGFNDFEEGAAKKG